MGCEPIELFFPEATEFIHNQLVQERPVLVHCRAGVSRSATVVLAYLVEYCGYSLRDAFTMTLQRRPTVTPNLGFMDKLRQYEEDKQGIATSVDIEKYMAWFQARDHTPNPNLQPDLE
jgi:protein-tyrosine phosphatase